MTCLFITGATGFIGSHLLEKLDVARYDHVYCLSRKKRVAQPHAQSSNVIFLEGDLDNAQVYAPYLSAGDTVVHLAAATGKVEREEYFSVNVRGTRILLEQCERAGVRNLLFVSTIAVKYPNAMQYYYAQSKREAEMALQQCRLRYAIARPTIVIGKESATWKSLSTLARLPFPVTFGNGLTNIQPIYIEDLVSCLMVIMSQDLFCNQVFELGGPEKITFDEFMRRIHFGYYGKASGVIHVPLGPVLALLSTFENHPWLPVPITTGQLSAFYNDGTVEPNQVLDRCMQQMTNVDQMIRKVISNE